jgi:hypothetical protein
MNRADRVDRTDQAGQADQADRSPPAPPSLASLRRATVIALLALPLIAVTVILPAERGFDPTGVGRVIGLTAMGEAKQELLAEEAAVLEMAAWKRAQERLVGTLTSFYFTDAGGALPDSARRVLESAVGEQHIVIGPHEKGELSLDLPPGAGIVYAWATDGPSLDWNRRGSADRAVPERGGRGSAVPDESTGEGTADAGAWTPAEGGRATWGWANPTDQPVTVVLRATPANPRDPPGDPPLR